MELFLGIDTSNYRTSLALTDGDDIISSKAVLLEVPGGSRGLRQSEAFFKHSNRLPEYLEEILSGTDASGISAVGVSERPRRQEGSYMPCFLAGLNLAKELGTVLRIPVYSFSHQEGHAAAVMSRDIADDCVFMHLSGGTTEFLLTRPDDRGFDMTIAGGTKDISFGQLLDRAGVAMGLPFPAGVYLDEAAAKVIENAARDADDLRRTVNRGRALPDIRMEDAYFNLSGIETALLRLIEKSSLSIDDSGDVLAELFYKISRVLYRASVYLTEKHGLDTVYMAGGVASSRSVRAVIRAMADADEYGPRIIFGDPDLSGDNAVGIARLARRMSKGKNR